jgi:cytochrome c oxidase subunit 3
VTTSAPVARADTGFSNGALGMWLFLASEAMLFGALFSGYALLRTGAEGWPVPSSRLSVPLAGLNTLVLIASSVTMMRAVRAARDRDARRARMAILLTLGLGVAFLAIKGSEWVGHLRAGELPSIDTFFAIYYTLTGVHALHVVGGVCALGWLLVARSSGGGEAHATRVSLVGLYWQFVDLIWVVLFTSVYLL